MLLDGFAGIGFSLVWVVTLGGVESLRGPRTSDLAFSNSDTIAAGRVSVCKGELLHNFSQGGDDGVQHHHGRLHDRVCHPLTNWIWHDFSVHGDVNAFKEKMDVMLIDDFNSFGERDCSADVVQDFCQR